MSFKNNFPLWISVWERILFCLCVFFKFSKYCLFLFSRRPDHSEFSMMSQTCPHGFPLGLVVDSKAGKRWGKSPTGVRMEVGEGVEGFHVHFYSLRRTVWSLTESKSDLASNGVTQSVSSEVSDTPFKLLLVCHNGYWHHGWRDFY